jgi:iron complex transport system permease protein
MTRALGRNQFLTSILMGCASWILVFLLALRLGAVPDASIQLILQIRMPRAILASAIGMGLSVAGAVLQVLFSNPLCEPYTLGISSGAALGAVIGISLGLPWIYAGIVGTAFLGAITFALILYYFSSQEGTSSTRLLLTGVMLGFLGSSWVAVCLTLWDSNGLQGTLVWLFGDLSRARPSGALFSFLIILFFSILTWTRARELDALLLGEEAACSMGVHAGALRQRLILFLSIIVAVCVSSGGMIGFIGLVVPHFVRRTVGSLHKQVIPLCAIWGAVALTLADCLSRVMVRPFELPVGVVTALIGAPIFLFIMSSKRNIRHV